MSEVTARKTTSKSADRRRRRQVAALVAVLVVLLLLATAVGFIVVRVLQPAGSSEANTQTGTAGLVWVRSIYGWGAGKDQQLLTPTKVAIGPDGTIFTNDGRAQIIAFDPAGNYKRVIGPGSMGAGTPSPLKYPQGLDVDTNGDLYVADQAANRVIVFDTRGRVARSIATSAFPRTVAVTDDRVYVGLEGSVAVYDKQGTRILAIGRHGFGPDEFNSPDAITVRDDGSFVVSDALNGRLKAYSADGKLQWIHPSYGANAKPVGGNLTGSASRDKKGKSEYDLPRGLVLDAAGRMIVIDAFKAEGIIVVQPTAKGGKTIGQYGDTGSTDGKMMYPSGIAYDRDRDWIVVADSGNNRLQILRLEGTGGAGGLMAAYRRANLGPVWVCSFPLLALILIVIMLVASSRRNRDRGEATALADQDEPLTETEEIES